MQVVRNLAASPSYGQIISSVTNYLGGVVFSRRQLVFFSKATKTQITQSPVEVGLRFGKFNSLEF